METMNFENIIGAVNGDETHVLGKFLYFSLSHLLVEKDELAALCDSLNIPHSVGSRVSVSDAFRSATGDIRDRLVSQQSGETKIYAIYCRDNERKPDMYSRELVKETLNERTNQYQKLANLHYDRTDGSFGYADLSFDADVDALQYCQRAEELFELYQRCANRRQIETICVGYLRSPEATKVNATGHLFFVPRHTMSKLEALEAFIEELVPLNRAKTPLTVNSFYIVDDAKQREKMTEEFYPAVKKEIAEYQERADYLIHSGCNSAAVMERWVAKIRNLEDKKRRYEDILRRELDGPDDEFGTLRLFSEELSLRASRLRNGKAAA